jgi:transglutaminase-like putative cysteine protease
MLAALRMEGVPARYVSGYLATGAGAEATHAWVQVWAEGAWHGFDPANNCPQDERYVVIGVGRDYDDIPPIRGSFRGSAEEEWIATVAVQSSQAQSQ